MNIEQKERFAELSGKVIEWAEARNIIKGSTPVSQFAKLVSEFGEFCGHAAELQRAGYFERDALDAKLKDDIGDQLVVITIIGAQLEAYLVDALDRTDDKIQTPFYAVPELGRLYGLLADNVLKGQLEQFEANVQLIFAELNQAAGWVEADLAACLEEAYNDIKDRKGVMYNGTFVKSTDVAYPGICAELGLEG